MLNWCRLSAFVLIFWFQGSLSYSQTVSTKSFTINIKAECLGTEEKKALKYLETARDRKNDKDERVEALRKCIEEDPACSEAHYYLGLEMLRSAVSNRASLSPAEKELKECIRLCPDFHHEPYYFLAAIALGRSDYTETVKLLDKYYKLSAASDDQLDDKREETIKLDYEFAKFFADAYANPVPFSPNRVGGVCTEEDEFLPLISPDNESMYFTRRFTLKSQVKASYGASSAPEYSERFMQSKRLSEAFEVGEPLPSPFNENESYHYGGASLSIDNKHIFVTVCQPIESGRNNCDIYTADLVFGFEKTTGLTGFHWTPLRSLGDQVNGRDSWESQPSISSDGKTLYFCSAREGSQGVDIYYSKKGANGEWGAAVSIGEPINTPYDDKTPFMHSDSRTLYFASNGHLGFGGLDVFLARQNEDGSWNKPVNLGHPINTEADEQAFAVSTDGRRVFYSAKEQKNAGSIDIWNFELYKEARPEKVLFVKGELKDEQGTPAQNASIELKTMQSNGVTKVDVDENDGKYAAVIRVREDENVVVNVKADNIAFQSKLIETAEQEMPKKARTSDDETEIKAVQTIDFQVAEVKEGGVYRINDIFYNTNSAEISEKSKAILDEFANYLKENKTIKIEIDGHTDDVGKAEDNLVLSTDRAFSVKQYLESKGVGGDRIKYKGFGESVPFTTNDTEEGKALNRRTEFLILSK